MAIVAIEKQSIRCKPSSYMWMIVKGICLTCALEMYISKTYYDREKLLPDKRTEGSSTSQFVEST